LSELDAKPDPRGACDALAIQQPNAEPARRNPRREAVLGGAPGRI
jgi:hypothetical protein